MIWLKRLLPLVLILIAWFAWKGITKSQQEKATAADTRYALVTAQTWVAATTFRENPAGYLAYRDSLLQANNITKDELFQHLQVFENDLDRQLTFSQTVSRLVDSLLKANPIVKKTVAISGAGEPAELGEDSLRDSIPQISRMPVPRSETSKQ